MLATAQPPLALDHASACCSVGHTLVPPPADVKATLEALSPRSTADAPASEASSCCGSEPPTPPQAHEELQCRSSDEETEDEMQHSAAAQQHEATAEKPLTECEQAQPCSSAHSDPVPHAGSEGPLNQADERQATAGAQQQDPNHDEPLLMDNPDRFSLFPIK